MIMHEECLEGNFQSIQRLREVPTVPVPHVRQVIGLLDQVLGQERHLEMSL